VLADGGLRATVLMGELAGAASPVAPIRVVRIRHARSLRCVVGASPDAPACVIVFADRTNCA